MNILIVRVSAIGDVIHTLPAISLIKKLYPNSKISWVVQQKAASLLLSQPFLDKVWVLPNKFIKPKNWRVTLNVINEIRKTQWNAILDFQGITKTSIILSLLKGPKYGFDYNNSRLGLTSYFTKYHTKPEYTNIIQKNLALACDVVNNKNCPTIETLKKDFKLFIPEEKRLQIKKWLKENNIKKFIALTPNTTWDSKEWPTGNWQKLLKKLEQNKTDVVLIGKDFGKQAKDLASYINKNNLKTYCAPTWDLLATSYLISKSDLFIGPDTGLLHIADFLDKKTIGIFGPTLAKKHGPFLNTESMKNAIQVICPHYYQKTHGKNKKTGIKIDCMCKLTPENLFNKIIQILSIG